MPVEDATMSPMVRMLRPFTRAVTYTRWLHLFVACVWPVVWGLIDSSRMYVAVMVLALAGLVPAMRTIEGMQADVLLLGKRLGVDLPRDRGSAGTSKTPAPREARAPRRSSRRRPRAGATAGGPSCGSSVGCSSAPRSPS